MPPVAPYEHVAYTVGNFIQRYLEILATGASMRAANFALTGCDSERQQQATVQPLAHPYRAHQRHSTMLRDYDSGFGFPDPLDVSCDIYVYPVSNPAQTLKQNIHIKVPFDIPGQANVKMNPHIIPNMAFATTGERILIRLFVPGLYAEDRDSYIHLDHQAMIYNDGIRAAVMQLTPEAGQNWCSNHQDAIFRARNHSRGLQYGTKAVSGYEANALCRLIKTKLEGKYGWARGIRFMVQIKGVKEAYQHDPRDAENELQRLLRDFDTETGQWYIDVGLEVSEPGLALQWTTDGQATVISHVADIPQHRATRATNPSEKIFCYIVL